MRAERGASEAAMRAERGFTLIEVVVALAILGLTLAAIFRVFSTGLVGLARVDEVQRAAIVADGLMAQLGTAVPLTADTALDGETDGFAWIVETAPYEETGLPGEAAGGYRPVAIRIAVGPPDQPTFELTSLRLVAAQ